MSAARYREECCRQSRLLNQDYHSVFLDLLKTVKMSERVTSMKLLIPSTLQVFLYLLNSYFKGLHLFVFFAKFPILIVGIDFNSF